MKNIYNNIDGLLAKRDTCRTGLPGDPQEALKRLEISKLIARNFEGFNVLRKHLIHPEHQPRILDRSAKVMAAISLLTDLGWIKPSHKDRWQFLKETNSSEFMYIKGDWLEEYVYCAHLTAGVDEVFFGQELEWRSNGVIGKNEIDVIARRGNKLSFTSCKTQNPYSRNGTTNQITGFLTEVDYWDTHFADGQGKLLLAITADFIDEMEQNRHRYPLVYARASILNVDVVSLEDLAWDKLVEKVGAHWDD